MARKLARQPEEEVSHLGRMLRSLQEPLSPESLRVLAAARVGLQLLARRSEHVPQLHVARRRKALRGGAPLREENLPGCIRELLEQVRRAEKAAGE